MPRELFAVERLHLKPLPAWIPEVYRLHQRTVDVEGYVSVNSIRYSVPVPWIGKDNPKPFVWTATVDSIVAKLARCRQALEQIQPGCTAPKGAGHGHPNSRVGNRGIRRDFRGDRWCTAQIVALSACRPLGGALAYCAGSQPPRPQDVALSLFHLSRGEPGIRRDHSAGIIHQCPEPGKGDPGIP